MLCCVVVECFDVSSFFRSFDVLQVTIPCTSTFEVMRFVGFCRLPRFLNTVKTSAICHRSDSTKRLGNSQTSKLKIMKVAHKYGIIQL